jgi:Tfp pilus assembly protein FimV
MAAILDPNRFPAGPRRPQLQLVPAHGGRPVPAPVALAEELGIRASHVVAALAALVLALALSFAVGRGALGALVPEPSAAAPAAAGASAAGAATVEVQAGDTLWSIAQRLQPTGDVRPLVDQLIALNGDAPLQPGSSIVVPG